MSLVYPSYAPSSDVFHQRPFFETLVGSRLFGWSLFALSWAFVSVGQPAHSVFFSLVSSVCGFALFWVALDILEIHTLKQRFWYSSCWFASVQLFQFSWALTHPYSYIYSVWGLVSFLIGAQFGIISGWMTRQKMDSVFFTIRVSALWIICEWSRLFWFSGISWNPVGLSLSASILSLQWASVGGIFGLSFLVIFTNLLLYRYLLTRRGGKLFLAIAILPYFFGTIHFYTHDFLFSTVRTAPLKVALVQPATAIKDTFVLKDPQSWVDYSMNKWSSIMKMLLPYRGKHVDLIVLPEYVVPFGTFHPIFPADVSVEMIRSIFGEDPPGISYKDYGRELEFDGKVYWMLNNAFFGQTIANFFHCDVVAGLEDRGRREDYVENFITAQVFFPHQRKSEQYAKRVLVPMGEYIPFELLKSFARGYGVISSFTPGSKAKVIRHENFCYGLSICYEETYGNVMRDNKLLGAELLVNLTNDFWYPSSILPQQHFDHARLRAVEMGIPLERSGNEGLTIAVDSLGRIIDQLPYYSDDQTRAPEAVLYVEVPRYTYNTLYTWIGDFTLIAICCAAILARRSS